jgi:hypothetical protein
MDLMPGVSRSESKFLVATGDGSASAPTASQHPGGASVKPTNGGSISHQSISSAICSGKRYWTLQPEAHESCDYQRFSGVGEQLYKLRLVSHLTNPHNPFFLNRRKKAMRTKSCEYQRFSPIRRRHRRRPLIRDGLDARGSGSGS